MSSRAVMVKPASSSSATPSPALAALPLTSTDPRTTWTQLLRPGFKLMFDRVGATEQHVVNCHVLMNEYGAVAAIGRADEPQPSGFFGFSRKFSDHSAAASPSRSGNTHICRKCTGSVCEWLNSLCRIPVPADITWTSPGRITEPVPMLSLCSRAPSRT